ncbi:MAG: hypothetical protein R3247_02220 [Rhodothermales bacterium]|nr:hypothetical protein [Rhodothermales bacterium]
MYVGPAPIHADAFPIEGAFVERDGEAYYRIAHYDRMPPFFISLVSDADHWFFISSNGALSAGRGTPERALFPYYTVDKIHDSQDLTGSKTILLVDARAGRGGEDGAARRRWLWEPFSDRYAGLYAVRRTIYKTLHGDVLRFEEVNDDLGLTFAVQWCTSERFGFVKRSELRCHAREAVAVRVLDGIQNLMPYGVSRALQTERSVLADAYKQNELLAERGLGLFTLSAQPVDRAEPSEALMATSVWSAGLRPDAYLLSTRQLPRFRRGEPVVTEHLVRAERGAYFVHARLELEPGDARRWDVVADIEQDAADVAALAARLADPAALQDALWRDVAAGTDRLRYLIGLSDGEQRTGEPMTTARHRMNVLFNIMRGGVFDEGYHVDRADLRAFLAAHNAPVARAHDAVLGALPERFTIQTLRNASREGDAQLERLCLMYLPLSFSRRHGDPSRPWNHYTIAVRDDDGSVKRDFEGNWRDIFQNWEALSRAFPGYLDSMITTFVNASTADGYNPYRITRGGIDWETIEPDDPWSYIGYWGDHQIIYLLRLLQSSRAHHPGQLERLLPRRLFSYANVPYRIKPYADLLRDPHDTVVYAADLEETIAHRVEAVGADGKLVWDADGEVLLVTLAEKLLVPLLAKLTNFIPGGGIWMNTQRPEWNDANNALVGYGISMVTLFALRRYVAFLRELFAQAPDAAAMLSVEVAGLLGEVAAIFETFETLAQRPPTDQVRKKVVDALGGAGSAYREALYAHGLSGRQRAVPYADVRALLGRVAACLDQSIRANRRSDGLLHAYNLIEAEEGGIGVAHLYPMLEGQVAALDAGVLTPEESLEVLAALRASALYRPDQHSYLLYPDRALPGFLEKNVIPPEALAGSALVQKLLAAGDATLIVQDVQGGLHFNGTFRNRRDVEAALDALRARGYAGEVERDREQVLGAFERVFDHRSYTGRSGTFFGYEGLGSIYWHMVSKLALAVQETFLRAHAEGAGPGVLDRLAEAYYDVRAGLGVNKTPAEYGAFPMDPYSHTPGHAGAKQPGMTGQVKEDVLCRWGELGVLVQNGCIAFEPLLLRAGEFLAGPAPFRYTDALGHPRTLDLDAGTLAFTYCGVPVVYRLADARRLRLAGADGTTTEVDAGTLSREISAEVFGRTGAVTQIEVDVPRARLR